MKKRICGGIFLLLAACASLAGGLFCYPPMPQTAEGVAALSAALQEGRTAAAPPSVQQEDAPAVLDTSTALQAFGSNPAFDPERDEILRISGSVTTGGQVFRYSAYLARPRAGGMPVVLDTQESVDFSDGFSSNILSSAVVAPLSPDRVQCIGSGFFERAEEVTIPVRRSWRVQNLHTTWYTRYPYSYSSFFTL